MAEERGVDADRRFVTLCLGGCFLPREQQDAESSRLEGGFY